MAEIEERLCYALPSEIPHEAHDWWGVDFRGSPAPSDPIKIGHWHCDGWAAVRAAYLRGISYGC